MSKVKDNAEFDYIVPGLQRGLKVLELFDTDRRTLTTHEIAESLGTTVSSVYRIVQTLHHMGYLSKGERGEFSLGAKLLGRGFTYLASRDVVDIAAPYIISLRDRTSLSCHMSIREHTDTLYIYRSFASQRLSVNIHVGTRIPCHCNAMGKVLLSGLSVFELAALYRSVRLDDHPYSTSKTFPDLQAEVSLARKRGWVIGRSDYATSVAAPIFDSRGDVIAAINLSGPDAIMASEEFTQRTRDMVVQCAKLVSAQAGYLQA